MLRSAVRSASLSLAAICALLIACEVPESFQMSRDAGAALMLPDAGWGTGGHPAGTGGVLAGSGSSDGGMTGSGGAAAAGGKGGGTDASGNNGAGGTPTASGGAGGRPVGSGGNGGGVVSAGGMLGRGGGPTGAGGDIGTAGRNGTGGTGAGGRSGAGGAGGAAGVVGPCAGICANPTKFTTQSYDSGPVGLGASCFETTADIHGGQCIGFAARLLKVNGMLKVCDGANWLVPLPAKRNGGYCFDISPGPNPAAGFKTF